MENDNKENKDGNDNNGGSWLITISFNIISDACQFSGSRVAQPFFLGSELIKNCCFHPMNKNWTVLPMWSMPKCKKGNCPIRACD